MKIIECSKGDFVWVQVQIGDTLDSVCQQYSVNKNNIIRNNPSIDLYDGEMIKIVNKTTSYHIVKPMETLSIIAKKYNIDEEKLIKINNLNSKRLFVGQSLKID